MKVMTLNCGSSSVKYALFDMQDRTRLCHGIVERVILGSSFIEHFNLDGQKYIHYHECPTHARAIRLIIDFLINSERGVIGALSEIRAVGHRVVHGGEKFSEPAIIDDKVIERIDECSVLAPLHNPANLAGIRAIMKLMPNILQAAIFDTAFFTTMPPHVFTYGVPYQWYEKYRVRKYGFHGTSHRYVSKRAAALLGKKPHEVNLITLHIGNGVSVTAIKGGVAYDHSMGFTPLAGAVMGTRCGDIDPGILLYVMGKENLGRQDMEDILYTKSGLFGITGKYIDRREIIKAMKAGDERARLSFEVECYGLRRYIGAYVAAIGGVDAVVFTGGVGENSVLHRSKICEGLEFFGIKFDHKKNKQAVGGGREMEISSPVSRVKVFVIPTDEELMIAEDTFELLRNSGQHN
ncbi:acetate/propionate family kinase [Chloroflexota bacterium]